MNVWHLAWLSILRRPLPSVIAVAAMAWAVAAGGIMLKLHVLSQSRFATLAHEGQSVVGAKAGGTDLLLGSLNLEGDRADFIPGNLFRSLRSAVAVEFDNGAVSFIPPVHAVVPLLYFADIGPFKVIGTDESFLQRPSSSYSPRLQSGRWVRTGAPEIVVGAEAARRQRLDLGSLVAAADVSLNRVQGTRQGEFIVVGLLEPTGKIWDYAFFSSLKYGQQWLADFDLIAHSIWGTDVLHYCLVYHDPEVFLNLQVLINQRTVAQIISISDEIAKLHKLTGVGKRLAASFTFLILFMAGACVAAMTSARYEAIALHMAILRALGFSKGNVVHTLLAEGLLLGTVACFLGGLVDMIVFPRIRPWLGFNFHGYTTRLPSLSVAVWLVILMAISCAVLVSAWRLCHQDLDQALKRV